MNLAVIPARSGSSRLKNKNILNFNGKPMIAWTIEAAVKSKIFDYIFVSTDKKKNCQNSNSLWSTSTFFKRKKTFR